MKRIILLMYLFSLYICQEETKENIQKALLIKTNLTKEELTQLLESNSKNNNTSVEEVQTETESKTESVLKSLKDGKLKIKIKLELDLNDIGKKEKQNENKEEGLKSESSTVQTAYIQTSIHEMPQKISLFEYILALLITLILISLFVLSSHFKKNKITILNKYKRKNEYLLKDN